MESLRKNFQNHSGFGRIQFLAVIKLRVPFLCQLSALGCSGCYPHSLRSPLHLHTNSGVSCLESLTSATSQRAPVMRLSIARLSLFCLIQSQLINNYLVIAAKSLLPHKEYNQNIFHIYSYKDQGGRSWGPSQGSAYYRGFCLTFLLLYITQYNAKYPLFIGWIDGMDG